MNENLYISGSSLLRFPPKNLNPKTVLDFATITYFTDICNIRFESLIQKLVEFSDNAESNNVNFPSLYSDVWEILASVTTLRRLILERFEFEDNHPHLIEFGKARLLRNTYQHIDDRIIEVLEKEDASLFGTISWQRNVPNTPDKIQSFMLYSGVFTKNKKGISGTVPKLPDVNSTKRIDEILFEAIVSTNRKNFESMSVSLITIMEDLKIIVESFEQQILEQMANHPNVGTHNTNLYIQTNITRT